MLIIGVVGLGACIGLIVYVVVGQAEEKASIRGSLRQLDDYDIDSVRERELLDPLRTRAFAPIYSGLSAIGKRWTPLGYADKIRQKLISAGTPEAQVFDRFLVTRVLTVVLAPVVGYLVYANVPLGGVFRLVATIVVVAGLVMGPDNSLNRKIAKRQYEIRRRLPDVMDLLVISVEAGLGFEQALDRTVASVPGALTDEFARMLGEVRAGSTRADAMRALDARINLPEIRSFVLAIIQADTFGVSIGRVLRSQADEMRIKRRQLAQERAQKAPVKMLIPMVFCIFPAMFVVIIGPAFMNVATTL